MDGIILAMGANFGDLDNDGFLDCYIGTGNPDLRSLLPNRMMRNAGGQRFEEATFSGGFGHIQKGHGISFADIDNDGDQDIYIVLGGAYDGDFYQNVLFENPGHGHRWPHPPPRRRPSPTGTPWAPASKRASAQRASSATSTPPSVQAAASARRACNKRSV